MGKSAATRTPQQRGNPEAVLKANIFMAVGSRIDFMVWNNPVGLATPIGTERLVKFGVAGAADILGCLLRRVKAMTVINPDGFNPLERQDWHFYGQMVCIETKSRTGRQRTGQVNFQHAVESVGGIYILARTVEDVLSVLGPEPSLADWNPDLLPANILRDR